MLNSLPGEPSVYDRDDVVDLVSREGSAFWDAVPLFETFSTGGGGSVLGGKDGVVPGWCLASEEQGLLGGAAGANRAVTN